jgi:hypothetical protein
LGCPVETKTPASSLIRATTVSLTPTDLLNMAPKKAYLFQLHWQNRQPPYETEFVGQVGGTDPDDIIRLLGEMCDRRQSDCPEGWVPLVCNEEAECFVWSVPPEIAT